MATKQQQKQQKRFDELEAELEAITNRICEIGQEIADMNEDEPKFKRMALRAGNSEPPLLRKLQWLRPSVDRPDPHLTDPHEG